MKVKPSLGNYTFWQILIKVKPLFFPNPKLGEEKIIK